MIPANIETANSMSCDYIGHGKDGEWRIKRETYCGKRVWRGMLIRPDSSCRTRFCIAPTLSQVSRIISR